MLRFECAILCEVWVCGWGVVVFSVGCLGDWFELVELRGESRIEVRWMELELELETETFAELGWSCGNWEI